MLLEASTDYASFLVRLWRSRERGPSEHAASWHGEAEHIQSGQRWTFDTLDDLLRVLRQQAEAAERSRSKDKHNKKGET
jgi:hypothetical protein